ncbi:heavy metal translocatin [Lojkania enalia]|uniref:Heavy metal translocatin n=1 Tax=Lojkania enalia TaxID=147567 RepID=A0A9P4NAF9_9PLEO|nr:heavy metal translocatin [Didymosphaeria enalia]
MACGSGCCSQPKSPQAIPSPPPENDTDSCCNGNVTSADSSSSGCEDGCCQNRVQDSHAVAKKDICCTENTVNTPQKDSGSTITFAGSSDELVPSCCEGKTSPCCDSTCIDRLALRECVAGNPITGVANCSRGRDYKPCDRHARNARDKYHARLEALGCICRRLLALGQESCCIPRHQALDKMCSSTRSHSVPTSVKSCTSADSCCAPAPTKPSIECSTTKQICADACCGDKKVPGTTEKVEELSDSVGLADLELGHSGKEHIILSISGMTCTGCETKLQRTLSTIPAITNLKTSLVLSRAEFDITRGTTSIENVMKHLERTTEFKCERITNQGSSLVLICPGSPGDIVKTEWPDGVTDIRVVDRKTIRVDFDAKIVGARDLLEKGWDRSIQLAPPRFDPTLDAGKKHVQHMGYMTILSILLTIPVLVLAWAPLPEKEIEYSSASLGLATVVQFVIAGPFYPKALKALIFSRVIEMDLLIVLSTSTAYIFSVVSFGYLVAGQPLSTGQFFETSTLLVTLIMVGRFVAAMARQKAVESISIRSLQTSTAIVVDKSGGEKEIDARLLQYSDVFKVLPESRIPTDGTVLSGSSEVNESMLTGESMPVEKRKNSSVIAGSINGSGTLIVRLIRIPGDNTISTIAQMVDEAKLSKPKVQEIADRVASYFVPFIITLCIITFSIWVGIGIAVRNQSGSEAVVQAITYAITVLIVSCPCAIGLAVPMVIVIATGVAAERGVIFKSNKGIELAYRTSHVVFDKTGTLTQGKLSVAREEFFDRLGSKQSLLLGLVNDSKHPVSVAVTAHLKSNGISATTISNAKTVIGKGVEGTFAGRMIRAGNSRWLGFESDPRVQSILSQGLTAFCFTVDNSLTAVFGLQDSLRSDALSTVSRLQKSGISAHILSGDDSGAVSTIATQLNIPHTNVRSRCTPSDKQAYVKLLLSNSSPRVGFQGGGEPVVMFCGDGTNDAVALAQATIGVHMNEGTDVAKSAADVVLMRPNLAGILTAIAVSKKSIHRIAFNFGWSFVYNLFAILLGAGAFVRARIPPEFAGLGELVSVLPVIAAGIALRWARI